MPRNTAFRLLAVVSIVHACALGQVVPVSGGGAALLNAVVAAPHGAVLVVAPGTYTEVVTTVAKDVTIVAPQGATVIGGVSVTFNGAWRLHVAGLNIEPIVQFPQLSGGFLATNGSLFVEECQALYLLVQSSAVVPVYVRDCAFGSLGANRLINVDAVLLDSLFVDFYNGGQPGLAGLTVSGAGSLRAERCSFTGLDSSFSPSPGLTVTTPTVLVDCLCRGGVGPFGQNWAIFATGALTLSSCTLNGPVSPSPTLRTVPSADFVSRAWVVGGTSQVRFHDDPNRVMAVVAAPDLVPWSSPLFSEKLWVGATPDWLVTSFGVTNGSGNLDTALTLPSSAALQYASVWLTGVVVDSLPWASSCPLGGIIQ